VRTEAFALVTTPRCIEVVSEKAGRERKPELKTVRYESSGIDVLETKRKVESAVVMPLEVRDEAEPVPIDMTTVETPQRTYGSCS
jgi:hypothetical protein